MRSHRIYTRYASFSGGFWRPVSLTFDLTPVTPAEENVNANFGFSAPFWFRVRSPYMTDWLTDGSTDNTVDYTDADRVTFRWSIGKFKLTKVVRLDVNVSTQVGVSYNQTNDTQCVTNCATPSAGTETISVCDQPPGRPSNLPSNGLLMIVFRICIQGSSIIYK